MKVYTSGRIDSPSLPVLYGTVSYQGITSANGNALGTTFVDADLDNEPPYISHSVKILSGPAAGQVQPIVGRAAGGIQSVGSAFTNSTGATQQITTGTRFYIISTDAGILSLISLMSSSPAVPSLTETWLDELGIDVTVWNTTNPATGAAWARGAVGELLMAQTAPNANETARLRSVQRWVASPGLYGVDRIMRKLTLEFEMHAVGAANFDNTTFFMGLTTGVADTRATNNIMGFALVGAGNALQTVTDGGGAETVNTGFGENLLLTNKFKMVISLNSVQFYLNETLIATHIANFFDAPYYIQFIPNTGAGGAATFRLGTVRISLGDRP